jgi:nuclear transport factor 2 (NTF2) superfamily protein
VNDPRPPLPPFDEASAKQKVRAAEDAWNSRDPQRCAGAYTSDSRWRNRSTFITGREEIIAFLTAKWERELDYRLIKELWGYTGNRIAVRFAYEWHSEAGQWFRAYGNENWEFTPEGYMSARHASINDVAIEESQRRFHWDDSGPRPADHPDLSDLDL